MKRLVTLSLVGVLVLSTWVVSGLHQSGESGPPHPFVIHRGDTVRAVASQLESAGLVDHAWQVRLAARLRRDGNRVKAGTYELQPGLSVWDILDRLVAGRVRTIAVTIPEGWTLERTASVLADSLGVEAEGLARLARRPSSALRRSIGLAEESSLEGYLFPETYRFAEGLSEEGILAVLLQQFAAVVDDSLRAALEARGLTLHEAVTLASIVEAEASRESEAPQVASVYLNRLAAGWKLEADPTVAYALGKQGQTITFADLRVESPYNTYRNQGLPPGPINSPGAAALRAVAWPATGFDAMYFVADGEGGHVFSRTWEEHSAAVEAYRRQRKLRQGG